MIRLLVIDDSSFVRKSLRSMLKAHEDICVVGEAADPYEAREMIHRLSPDVLTLDIEMPRMDGLTFLSKLMKHHPLPVVVFSSHEQRAVHALALGATELLAKPSSDLPLATVSGNLVRAIRSAAATEVVQECLQTRVQTVDPVPLDAATLENSIIAIGASTGGPHALEILLGALPRGCPGIVVAQHMPAGFTEEFAKWLNESCMLEIREAADGDPVSPGTALIAPGNLHTRVARRGGRYSVRVEDGPTVHFQRPSVDVLFRSVASSAGRHAVGVLLTGMGQDGALGLKEMRRQGARTLAQNKASCAVFGMPKQAIEIEAVERVLPLRSLPRAVLAAVSQRRPSHEQTPAGAVTRSGIED